MPACITLLGVRVVVPEQMLGVQMPNVPVVPVRCRCYSTEYRLYVHTR
jgi:hypothetical protein